MSLMIEMKRVSKNPLTKRVFFGHIVVHCSSCLKVLFCSAHGISVTGGPVT